MSAASLPPPPLIRVLLVDDSAFVRKVVREILSSSPRLEVVGAARDGEDALLLTEELRPDVVVCDLVMPRLDGAGYVRRQMARRAVPIILLSAAAENAAIVIEALAAGAIEVVQKPSALATEELRSVRAALVEQVEAAACASLENLIAPGPATSRAPAPAAARRAAKAAIVVIGISTGGPQALRYLIPLFPAEFPIPIAIVLHMPVGYTALYAEKLDELCALDVREAKSGDLLRPGLVLIAPAGRHLGMRRGADGRVQAQLSLHPLDKLHRPSADVLFQSAAETFGPAVLAVVMTGMGDDGREGAAWVKAKGGTVITEAEKSCVIYGMPRSIVEAGLSDGAAPLDEMAAAILSHL